MELSRVRRRRAAKRTPGPGLVGGALLLMLVLALASFNNVYLAPRPGATSSPALVVKQVLSAQAGATVELAARGLLIREGPRVRYWPGDLALDVEGRDLIAVSGDLLVTARTGDSRLPLQPLSGGPPAELPLQGGVVSLTGHEAGVLIQLRAPEGEGDTLLLVDAQGVAWSREVAGARFFQATAGEEAFFLAGAEAQASGELVPLSLAVSPAGEVVWTRAFDVEAPPLAVSAGARQLAVAFPAEVWALATATGEILWRYRQQDVVAAAVVVSDDHAALLLQDGSAALMVVIGPDGGEIWRKRILEPVEVLRGPLLSTFLVVARRHLYLLDEGGRVAWDYVPAGPVVDAAGDGALYAVTLEDGRVVLLERPVEGAD